MDAGNKAPETKKPRVGARGFFMVDPMAELFQGRGNSNLWRDSGQPVVDWAEQRKTWPGFKSSARSFAPSRRWQLSSSP